MRTIPITVAALAASALLLFGEEARQAFGFNGGSARPDG
jgi:hypothetical protein